MSKCYFNEYCELHTIDNNYYLAYYSLHCSSFSGPAKESKYSGNLIGSKPFEQSMPATNQAPSNSLKTNNYQQDQNVNNVRLYLKTMKERTSRNVIL